MILFGVRKSRPTEIVSNDGRNQQKKVEKRRGHLRDGAGAARSNLKEEDEEKTMTCHPRPVVAAASFFFSFLPLPPTPLQKPTSKRFPNDPPPKGFQMRLTSEL